MCSAICGKRAAVTISTLVFLFLGDFRYPPNREGLEWLLDAVMPAVWDRLPTVLSPANVERLINAPDTATPLGRRDRAALETLYATGCRASEVVGLRPADAGFVANQRAPDIACLPRLAWSEYRSPRAPATARDGGLSATREARSTAGGVRTTTLWAQSG